MMFLRLFVKRNYIFNKIINHHYKHIHRSQSTQYNSQYNDKISADQKEYMRDKLIESDYYIENDLRKVYPYHYRYKVYAKNRWFHRKVFEVWQKEFGVSHEILKSGSVTVNDNSIDESYIIKAHDIIEYSKHRHESPVLAVPIPIIYTSDDVIVIDKPPSIPVSTGSKFRYNTVLGILEKDYNLTDINMLHRLDRLTSGVMLMARTPEKANKIRTQFMMKDVSKEYVCRVKGEFPNREVTCQMSIKVLSKRSGISIIDPFGKSECITIFKKLHYNGKTSTVLCRPITGRTHQIRVHLQYLGFPILGDLTYNNTVFGPYKGRFGDYGGKSAKELEDDIVESNNRYKRGEIQYKHSIHEKEIALKVMEHYCSLQENWHIIKDKYTIDDNKLIHSNVSNCNECLKEFSNFLPHHLMMYLHALRYSGPDWNFETKMPFWAKETCSV